MNRLESQLRNLAKSNYWQNIYRNSKSCSGIQLFYNCTNFSGLQNRFLYWLTVYDSLYTELATHEDKLLTEAVIYDEYRTDAYLIYRHKKHDYLWKQYREDEQNTQLKANRTRQFKHSGNENVINVDLRREE